MYAYIIIILSLCFTARPASFRECRVFSPYFWVVQLIQGLPSNTLPSSKHLLLSEGINLQNLAEEPKKVKWK